MKKTVLYSVFDNAYHITKFQVQSPQHFQMFEYNLHSKICDRIFTETQVKQTEIFHRFGQFDDSKLADIQGTQIQFNHCIVCLACNTFQKKRTSHEINAIK